MLTIGLRRSLALLVFAVAAPAAAQFTGTLELIPAGCEVKGKCISKNTLRFVDGSGIAWEAMAGLETDGASIPAVFQPLVGSPFDAHFIKAAVVHDHYCDRHVRPWRQTHRVFYEALVAQGVPKAKAKIMYFAVYMGGPKWVELITGNNCGPNCVNRVASLSSTTEGRKFYARRADFSGRDLLTAVDALSARPPAEVESMTLEEIEERARELRPNDFYFTHPATVTARELGVVE